MTPYELHKSKKHNDTISSPNGIDKIVECSVCGLKWLVTPSSTIPITIYPNLRTSKLKG